MPALKTQLCVVGAGLAGLTAALRAAEQGVQVLVLEQSSEREYLCNSRLTGGVFHVCVTDIQTDPDVLEKTILRVTGGHAHPALARAVAHDTRRAVKWLQSKGARFIRGSAEPHQNFVLAPPALHRQGLDWKGRGGDATLRLLEAALVKAGGSVLRGYRATALRVEDGNCRGLRGTTAQGADFAIDAAFVLIADGGFQNAPELLQAHITPQPTAVLARNAGASRGDGLRMAQAAGARLSDLRGFYGHVQHREALSNPRLWPYPWLDDIVSASVLVDGHGQRFTDEGRGGIYGANAIARLPDPQGAWVVFDEAVWSTAGKSRFLPPNPHLEQAGGRVVRADTAAALEPQMGLPVGALQTTLSHYNAALSASTPGTLTPARSIGPRGAAPLQGPLLAVPVVAGITNTMGGIAIDEWGQAMTAQGTPFPGLFAAGGASGGLEGGESIGYVGGLAKAAVTGLRAADRIAALCQPAFAR
ncbi:FAD-dependent oxidoreductase [Hydrogenophaga palleronii]|uniref:FAD-dependent oxidoreductase n=1 Tax=Hydrogenophaga palleronii TaxID=65655 RepID=UPI0008263A6A|nr:FAD-dependent oxidoreductase [Hydrogenophaga palleronii]